jgi:hypothetical protein
MRQIDVRRGSVAFSLRGAMRGVSLTIADAKENNVDPA